MANQVKVRVRCVVDISVGVWGDDSQLNLLREQARKEGLDKIRRIMAENHGAVYGESKVIFVMVDEE